MEIQVNVEDRYILLKAQEEPEKCQDLVVRVARYTALSRFRKELSKGRRGRL
jgi:pyruvate-formate lyase